VTCCRQLPPASGSTMHSRHMALIAARIERLGFDASPDCGAFKAVPVDPITRPSRLPVFFE
jgi:hypothetical protein